MSQTGVGGDEAPPVAGSIGGKVNADGGSSHVGTEASSEALLPPRPGSLYKTFPLVKAGIHS